MRYRKASPHGEGLHALVVCRQGVNRSMAVARAICQQWPEARRVFASYVLQTGATMIATTTTAQLSDSDDCDDDNSTHDDSSTPHTHVQQHTHTRMHACADDRHVHAHMRRLCKCARVRRARVRVACGGGLAQLRRAGAQ